MHFCSRWEWDIRNASYILAEYLGNWNIKKVSGIFFSPCIFLLSDQCNVKRTMVFRDWPVLFDKFYFKTVRFVLNKGINNELSFINVNLVCTRFFRDKGACS